MEEQRSPDKQTTTRKPSHREEAMRVIEEYAAGLREIIEKLRRSFN